MIKIIKISLLSIFLLFYVYFPFFYPHYFHWLDTEPDQDFSYVFEKFNTTKIPQYSCDQQIVNSFKKEFLFYNNFNPKYTVQEGVILQKDWIRGECVSYNLPVGKPHLAEIAYPLYLLYKFDSIISLILFLYIIFQDRKKITDIIKKHIKK